MPPVLSNILLAESGGDCFENHCSIVLVPKLAVSWHHLETFKDTDGWVIDPLSLIDFELIDLWCITQHQGAGQDGSQSCVRHHLVSTQRLEGQKTPFGQIRLHFLYSGF